MSVKKIVIESSCGCCGGLSLCFKVLLDEGVYFGDGFVCADGIVVLIYDELFEDGLVVVADEMSVLAVYYVVFLAVDEQCGSRALADLLQDDFKGVVLELLAVFLCHLEGEGNDEVGSLDVLACDLECDHIEGVEGGVDHAEHHVGGAVLNAVEESSSSTHGAAPEHESFETSLSQVVECAIST
jgi:hypothetical protein